MKFTPGIFPTALVLILAGVAPILAEARESILLDREWRFHLGDFAGTITDAADTPDISDPEATPEVTAPTASATPTPAAASTAPIPPTSPASPQFDDRGWRPVDVPHDYVVEGTFKEEDKPFERYGSLPREVGWYRRPIAFPASASGKIAWLEFDGVFRNSSYWLNGKPIGTHKSGYIDNFLDLGPAAAGTTASLAVRVDPRKPEGWWYDGGGIYRHVRLVLVDPIHVAHWGVFVRTTVPNPGSGVHAPATLHISTELENQSSAAGTIDVAHEVLDAEGKIVAKTEQKGMSLPVGRTMQSPTISLADARLWSCEHPVLYTLRTTLRRGAEIVDQVSTPFGVRDIRFDADRGFFLNGQRVEIKGVCYHHDHAGTGIAVPDRLGVWRLEQLKKFGANGLRAHHALSTEILDACDRMGILFLDEFRQFGDDYGSKSTGATRSDKLEDQVAQVMRDRNHPSVILWSLCNEEQGIQGLPEGARLATALKAMVNRLDDTRPITAGLVYPNKRTKGQDPYAKTGILGTLDVIGFNYGIEYWDKVRAANQGKPFVVTELTRMMNGRGIYDQDKILGGKGNAALGLCNQYGTATEDSWKAVARRPWLAGVFVWVGLDFKGEAKAVAWPPIGAHKGILDICGFEKDTTWYYKAWWKDEPVIHVFPHWNWPGKEGNEIPVWVYSNAAEVELFLNGASLGKKEMPRNGHLEWNVKYQPGTLEARGTWAGGKTLADKIETTNEPAAIVLEPDRTELAADGSDLSIIAIKVVDSKGRLVPTATNLVRFTVSKGGSVLGVGNGNQSCHEPDKASQRSVWAGLAQVLVQAGRTPGSITVRAEADGLKPASVNLMAK